MRYRRPKWLSVFALCMFLPAATCWALPTGHHGAVLTDCTDPRFFEETPASDAHVNRLERFSFTASDNTEPSSIKVQVNLKPVEITITPKRSGRFQVDARLPEPVVAGRAWIRVMGMSVDGCHQLHTWNVYADSQ